MTQHLALGMRKRNLKVCRDKSIFLLVLTRDSHFLQEIPYGSQFLFDSILEFRSFLTYF